MASNHICRACLRTIRTQRPQWLTSRTLSTTTSLYATTKPAAASNTPPRDIYEQPTAGQSSTRVKLAQTVRKSLPQATETYAAYAGSELLFKGCSAPGEYDIPKARDGSEGPKLAGGEDVGVPIGDGIWYKDLSLTPTFNTWAQITMLHLYITTTRLRQLSPSTCKTWSQHLTDHFFTHAEEKMEVLHTMTSRGTRAKYLKDLFQQWRGVLISYDEGLVKGDAVLAAAVWRNLFGGAEEVDAVKLAMVVGWLRREVVRVAGEADGSVEAWVGFGPLESEESLVLMKSHLLDKPMGK